MRSIWNDRGKTLSDRCCGAIPVKQAYAQILVIPQTILDLLLQGFRSALVHNRSVARPVCGGFAAQDAAKPQSLIQDAFGHFALADSRQREIAAIAGKQGNDVGVEI